jgi:hypothetical protein
MGVIRAGILSRVSGKVAGVVGGSWKNKAYLREYVIPANPNTTPQQVQRGLMAVIVAFGKALVGPIFNAYTDRFERGMSGFNRFVKDNIAVALSPITYASVKLANGKLWKPDTVVSLYAGSGVSITFDGSSIGNNGAASDNIYAAAYVATLGLWYFPVAEVLRSADAITIVVPAGLNPIDVHTWIFAIKRSVTSPTLVEMISDSVYDLSAAP